MHPSLQEFREAQDRLIEEMGESVVLLTPIPTTYPPGTKLDPESGKPMDTWVQPVSSGFSSAMCSASVSSRPLTGSDTAPTTEGPLGVVRSDHATLIVRLVDRPKATGATEALYQGIRYRVEDVRYDHGRVLVFLEKL